MVGSILGYMRTKVSFWLVLVGLGSPFYSELVSILVAGVIHSIVQALPPAANKILGPLCQFFSQALKTEQA